MHFKHDVAHFKHNLVHLEGGDQAAPEAGAKRNAFRPFIQGYAAEASWWEEAPQNESLSARGYGGTFETRGREKWRALF